MPKAVRSIPTLLVVLALISAGCAGTTDGPSHDFNGDEFTPAYKAAAFTLENHQNDLVSISDHEGKVIILAFIFTRCSETCPVTSANIKWVISQLDANDSAQVEVLSVTLDFQYDSPAVLANYSRDGGYNWPHLTGSFEALNSTWAKYGVSNRGTYYQNGSVDIDHSQVTFIIDKSFKLRLAHEGEVWLPELFLADVQYLLSE
jgi:protein SCO1/2